MDNQLEYILETINKIHPISTSQAQMFLEYFELLCNSKSNVTAITDFKEVVIKHFFDSLIISEKLKDRPAGRIIDVGSGGGLPGIPIAISFPEHEVVLLETVGKKVSFLDEVISRLGLNNVTTVLARAEDAGRDPNMRERFDIAVSRAVAPVNTLMEYMVPFVSVGGYIYSYKGSDVVVELEQANQAISQLGVVISLQEDFSLPDNMGDRSLITFKKERPTPDKYPRRSGIPKKRPL